MSNETAIFFYVEGHSVTDYCFAILLWDLIKKDMPDLFLNFIFDLKNHRFHLLWKYLAMIKNPDNISLFYMYVVCLKIKYKA